MADPITNTKFQLDNSTLQNDHQFQLGDFVAGVMSQRDQVAIAHSGELVLLRKF